MNEILQMYVTMVDNPDSNYHRSKIIVHKGWQWYLAEFPTETAFHRWLDYCGLEIKLEETTVNPNFPKCGIWKRFSVNRKVKEEFYFWKKEEVPDNAKLITLLSNGSLVTGFILNDGEVLHIYRPNPNAKEVYNPMPSEERIEYVKENGLM